MTILYCKCLLKNGLEYWPVTSLASGIFVGRWDLMTESDIGILTVVVWADFSPQGSYHLWCGNCGWLVKENRPVCWIGYSVKLWAAFCVRGLPLKAFEFSLDLKIRRVLASIHTKELILKLASGCGHYTGWHLKLLKQGDRKFWTLKWSTAPCQS